MRLGDHDVTAVDDDDAGQPKVRQHEVARTAHQQIVRFQVPVDAALQQSQMPNWQYAESHAQRQATHLIADERLMSVQCVGNAAARLCHMCSQQRQVICRFCTDLGMAVLKRQDDLPDVGARHVLLQRAHVAQQRKQDAA